MVLRKTTAHVETMKNIEIEEENQMHPGIMELRFYAVRKFCCKSKYHQICLNESTRERRDLFLKVIAQRSGIC